VVALDEIGMGLQLQVHDEVDWSPANVAEAKEARQCMVEVIQLNLPTRVDLEIGPNWGEAKEKVA
jgi:DNA polymerase I-like protein with 3'-5' exonuclease and polymerase domains